MRTCSHTDPSQPLELSSIWKMAENYLLGQQFPSDNTIRDEIQKWVWEQAQKISSHAIAGAWTSLVTLGTRKGLVPTHTTMCFNSTGLQKNRETQFLTSLAVWVSVVIQTYQYLILRLTKFLCYVKCELNEYTWFCFVWYYSFNESKKIRSYTKKFDLISCNFIVATT
jgi:hypothetical protein